MFFFGVCFFLYFIKLSAGNGFFSYKIVPTGPIQLHITTLLHFKLCGNTT